MLGPDTDRAARIGRQDANAEMKRRRQAGFTLVELLVVMAILVLLTSIVAPRVIGYIGSSRTKAAQVQIEGLSTSLELYRLDVGKYPTTNEGLAALVRRPSSARAWNGPYIKGTNVPADPWGAAYLYRSPGKHGAFDIFSYGADGRAGGEGENQDATSW